MMVQTATFNDAQAERVSGVSNGVLSELDELLVSLSPAEQTAVLNLLRRANEDERPMDEVGIVTDYLKVDPNQDDFTVFQQIETMHAPPVLKTYPNCETIALPQDLLPIEYTLPQVIRARASRRDQSKGDLSMRELSTLLYYTYGIRGKRMAYNVSNFPSRFVPSAGGLQSANLYMVVNSVEGLEKGLYHYNASEHGLDQLERGYFRRKVIQSCMFQDWLSYSSVVFFVTCCLDRLQWKYGRRSYRFTHIDAGILSQNLHLVTTALRLRSCFVSGYNDDEIHSLLNIDGRREFIALLVGVGRKPWEDSAADVPEK